MPIHNQKEEAPFAYYASRFREMVPEEALARRGSLKWDGGKFYVNFLGREYAISHPDCAIRAMDGKLPPMTWQTFLLRYLLEGQDAEWAGQWKTFRELPWGEMYSGPFSGRVLTRAAFTFGTRLGAFRAACRAMGAEEVDHGDAGFCFTLLPGYRMQLLVWEGDEEFTPSAQLLYSDNFAVGFTAEDRVVAADILIAAIKGLM